MTTIDKMLDAILAALRPQDIKKELTRQATQSSADYVRLKMRGIQSVSTAKAVLDRAIEATTIKGGLVLEFGVFSGRSINHIAAKRNWQVDGFDSFEGLPEAWRDGFDRGAFRVDSLPTVRENVKLHKGWFDETLPDFVAKLTPRNHPIALLHVDCDLYSSTKTIFEFLAPNIVPGTVIVFDEYFNYDGWEYGEFLAFKELLGSRKLKYEYLTYNHLHEQVGVVIQ